MANYPLKQIPVWNQFDEFGLLVGLGHWSNDGLNLEYVRYPGETNKQLKDRTIQTSAYKGNATVQGMLDNISRDLSIGSGIIMPRYNLNTKNIFYLSQKPYTDPSGIQVYVYNSGILTSSGTLLPANQITPQVRASGYSTATSGWIVWNLPDFDASAIPNGLPGSSGWYSNNSSGNVAIGTYPSGIQYGEYTQILEFIGSSIPNTGDRVRVDYQIQNGLDLYGQVVLDKRTDFSNPDDNKDTKFIGSKTEYPLTSGLFNAFVSEHVSIFTLDQLSIPAISGVFYDELGKPTAKLIEIANIVNDEYPLYWDSFRYDMGRWDQLDMAAVGSIPSFHDESMYPLSGYLIKGGSRYGVDLDCIRLEASTTSSRSPWYPVLVPGEFYIGNERFNLFGKMMYENLILSGITGGILSGHLTSDPSGRPIRLGVLTAYSSGRFYNDTKLPNSPYFKRLHDFNNVVSGVYYRAPFISYSGGMDITQLNFDGNNFYYDYSTGSIYASGINPTGFIVTWEHPLVYTSGVQVLFSGGYGFNGNQAPDFNPLVDPFDKILYLD